MGVCLEKNPRKKGKKSGAFGRGGGDPPRYGSSPPGGTGLRGLVRIENGPKFPQKLECSLDLAQKHLSLDAKILSISRSFLVLPVRF